MAGFRVSLRALIVGGGLAVAGLAHATPDPAAGRDEGLVAPPAAQAASEAVQAATVRVGQFDLHALRADAFADWDAVPAEAANAPSPQH